MNAIRIYICMVMLCLTLTNAVGEIIHEEERLEPALVAVKYNRRVVLDTLDADNRFRNDILTLKCGKTQSAFYSTERRTADSLSHKSDEYFYAQLNDFNLFKHNANLDKSAIFKNYPMGKITVHQRYDRESWVYTEDFETPVWTVTDSVANVLDYQCVMAVSDFRGRRWIAWFAPELPISNGPWKLGGLPGLILKAEDSKGHYSYEAIEVADAKGGYVEFFNYDDRLTTKRIASLRHQRKCLNKNIGEQIIASGAYGIDPTKVKPRKEPRKNYDFEETDYPHE
ncbi:MAG: GLPGLI family protein [Muribaculaceae bacterium]|nr:GLPGLI family protein [Muribaculaceae bacterium]